MINLKSLLFFSFFFLIFTSFIFAQTNRWRLIWDKNKESDMLHYEIYRSIGAPNASTKYGPNINHHDPTHFLDDSTMFFVDDDLVKGELIYYRLKAVDSTNLSSDFSEEVSAAIPELSIPDITIYRNQTVYIDTLDKYVNDPDHTDIQIEWDVSATTNLNINIENRIITITRINTNWFGTETVTFTATDPDTFFDVQSVDIKSVDKDQSWPPQVSNIPNQTIRQGMSFTSIILDNYVSDQDNVASEISWSFTGNTDLLVEIDANRVASISSPSTNWVGSETITFVATDPDTLTDSDQATFTIQPVNAPIVGDIPDQTITEGSNFNNITLDDYIDDPDHSDDEITWTFTGNTFLTITITENRIASINYPDNWTGNESITFRATDPDNLFDEDIATFTVELNSSIVNENVTAYPIPLRPSQGGAGEITFSNLPEGGKLIIYDLLGYPVYETNITSTEHPWKTTNQHGKWVRSGVYLYIVKDSKGKKVKSDKVIIIR